MIEKLKERVLEGKQIGRESALSLYDADLEPLCAAANEIRTFYCGRAFDLCTITNGKSGACSEDCLYCAQSSHYKTDIEEHPLLEKDRFFELAKYNKQKGVLRYSVVTSGKQLNDQELDTMCDTYSMINKGCDISLCASHGLLDADQLRRLRESGVVRYHNNLETSRNYFTEICSTHTYEEKIKTIRAAVEAGLKVCSGGIIGLGETMADRIDMALEIRSLAINSVPINIFTPIQGTPLGERCVLKAEEIRKTVAIFRFLLPRAALRIAGGRALLKDKGRALFLSGANAAITGDMLTTDGISIEQDINMVRELGYEVGCYE